MLINYRFMLSYSVVASASCLTTPCQGRIWHIERNFLEHVETGQSQHFQLFIFWPTRLHRISYAISRIPLFWSLNVLRNNELFAQAFHNFKKGMGKVSPWYAVIITWIGQYLAEDHKTKMPYADLEQIKSIWTFHVDPLSRWIPRISDE